MTLKKLLKNQNNRILGYFQFAGKKYWTAAVFPALIGTTLPFWLNPPNFKFKIVEAILFLIMTVSGHIGFSLLYFGYTEKNDAKMKRKRLFIFGILCSTVTVLLGFFINHALQLHPNVPEYIFIIYGIVAIFAGLIYVAPPFSFHQRLNGEVVIGVGIGMLPVLGAYLVQVGDITRTVYLASLPVVISTCLWMWITELMTIEDDKKKGYKTTVMYFKYKFSSRVITFFLILLIYASLVLAVFGRSSLNPVSLVALFSLIFALMIIKTFWKDYENKKVLQNAEKYAFLIHLSICVVIILSSLSSLLNVR